VCAVQGNVITNGCCVLLSTIRVICQRAIHCRSLAFGTGCDRCVESTLAAQLIMFCRRNSSAQVVCGSSRNRSSPTGNQTSASSSLSCCPLLHSAPSQRQLDGCYYLAGVSMLSALLRSHGMKLLRPTTCSSQSPHSSHSRHCWRQQQPGQNLPRFNSSISRQQVPRGTATDDVPSSSSSSSATTAVLDQKPSLDKSPFCR
jgi:hypothetical protein